MPNRTLAIIINIFFPGIGTLIVGKTTSGIIQLIIMVVCVLGTFLTLGFGGIILVPAGIANVVWAVVSAATASREHRSISPTPSEHRGLPPMSSEYQVREHQDVSSEK